MQKILLKANTAELWEGKSALPVHGNKWKEGVQSPDMSKTKYSFYLRTF